MQLDPAQNTISCHIGSAHFWLMESEAKSGDELRLLLNFFLLAVMITYRE